MNLTANQKKYLIIGGVALISIIILNKWIHSLPKPQNPDLPATDELDEEIILKKGSKGDEVSELQRILLKDYSANLGGTGDNKDGVDGDFGVLTEVALKKAKGVNEIALKDL